MELRHDNQETAGKSRRAWLPQQQLQTDVGMAVGGLPVEPVRVVSYDQGRRFRGDPGTPGHPDGVFQGGPGQAPVLLPGGQVAEVEDLTWPPRRGRRSRRAGGLAGAVAHLLADGDRLGVDLGADPDGPEPGGEPEGVAGLVAGEVGDEHGGGGRVAGSQLASSINASKRSRPIEAPTPGSRGGEQARQVVVPPARGDRCRTAPSRRPSSRRRSRCNSRARGPGRGRA